MLLRYRFYFLMLGYCLISVVFPLSAQQWAYSHPLSPTGQNASHPQIAIDSFGNAIAIWYRYDGSHLVIQASTKPSGGNWQGGPDNLSHADQDCINPQIVIDSSGNATVVWERFNGSHFVIQALVKPFGGGWQSLTQISLPGQNASSPQIAVDLFGNVTAVWQAFNGTHTVIQASTKLLGENWQTEPNVISSSDLNAKNPQIVIDPYEIATVVWQASNGFQEVIQAASRSFPGAWQSTPDTLSSGALSNSSPQIGFDAFGNITAVWNQFDGNYGIIQTSTKLFQGNWQAVADTISLPGRNTFSPQIGVDVSGDVTVVWECFDERKFKCIHASTKCLGEKWQDTPNCLSLPGDQNSNAQIAIDPSGNAMVVWNSFKGFSRIHVSIKPYGGNWQEKPEIISSPERSSFSPQFAFDPAGRATVIWIRQDSLSFIQAADRGPI